MKPRYGAFRRLGAIGAALVLLTLSMSCGRSHLHTGTTFAPAVIAPPMPVPTHTDGTCEPGLATCGGSGAGYCFDLQSYPGHCGACDNTCPLGTPCVDGQCQVVPCTERISVRTLRMGYSSSSTWRYQVALADFDGDGAVDMVAPTPYDPTGNEFPFENYRSKVIAFHGNGDGTFTPGQAYTAGLAGSAPGASEMLFPVVTADLNLDQIPDLVMRAERSLDLSVPAGTATTIVVRLGNGDGTFGPEIGLAAGDGPSSIVASDVDGDVIPDLVVITGDGTRLSVHHGNGDGTFSEGQDLAMDAAPRSTVQVADWNADGIPDLVVADEYIHVLLGTGQGQFAPVTSCGITLSGAGGGLTMAILADFDRDGALDLVSSNTVLFGMHDCNASKRVTFHAAYNNAIPLTAADLNGDGIPDIAFASWEGVGYLPSDGQGGFGEPVVLGNFDDPQNRAQPDRTNAFTADVNGDGRLDLVVANQISIRVFLNTCS
jgi:hypothetical protein